MKAAIASSGGTVSETASSAAVTSAGASETAAPPETGAAGTEGEAATAAEPKASSEDGEGGSKGAKGDKKSAKGKLRVLYEGYPMALLTEQAGGVASTGRFRGKVGRIMDVVPENIHDRCPIIMGCPRDVAMILSKYN